MQSEKPNDNRALGPRRYQWVPKWPCSNSTGLSAENYWTHEEILPKWWIHVPGGFNQASSCKLVILIAYLIQFFRERLHTMHLKRTYRWWMCILENLLQLVRFLELKITHKSCMIQNTQGWLEWQILDSSLLLEDFLDFVLGSVLCQSLKFCTGVSLS